MKKIIKVFIAVVFAITSIFAVTLSANADRIVKLGDLDDNGNINPFDYVILKRAYMGTYQLNDVQTLCGDCNKNGTINAMDFVLLKRVYLGTFVFENPDVVISDSSSSGSNGPTYEDDGYYDEVIKP